MTKGQVLGIKNKRNDANLDPIFLLQLSNLGNKNLFQNAETASTLKIWKISWYFLVFIMKAWKKNVILVHSGGGGGEFQFVLSVHLQ